MSHQYVYRPSHAAPCDITLMGMHAKHYGVYALGHEDVLLGRRHPNDDVGLTLEQILYAICQDEFDREFRILVTQLGEDRRQQLRAHDFACRYTHRAFDTRTLTGGGSL